MQTLTEERQQETRDALPEDALDELASESASSGNIRHATWFSDGVLLLAGAVCVEDTYWPTATVTLRGKRCLAEAQAICYDAPDGDMDAPRETLLMLRCTPGDCTAEVPQGIILGSGLDACTFSPTDLPQRLTDLSTLLRETVTGCDADTRSRVLQFLVSAGADRLSDSRAARLNQALFAAREALRERLPGATMAKGTTLGGHIDSLFAIGANAFYVHGWVSTHSPLTRVTAVSPEGCRVELLDCLYCYRRAELNGLHDAAAETADVLSGGFRSYFEMCVPSRIREGWLIEVANESGDEAELEAPMVVRDPTTVRNTLLADVIYDPDNADSLLSDHIAPALRLIQERQQSQISIAKVVQYGMPPATPSISIIIPLYGRIDFIEQQMAQFVHDPEISQADVIYVLDSPELSAAIFAAAPRLEKLYRVPFRVAALKSNVGFSGANNAGVSLARGRLLLLLNPDILPDQPGWLGRLASFYDATPKVGAVGPKLLYEDDAIQHAGLFFYREPASGLWNNEHYYKGLHRTLPLANVTRPLPAVSAACMMIAADLYRDIEGLSGLYVQGDYEDSELCLRLIEAGRRNWYLPEVELYHLEGQSYPSELRQLTGGYNRWLHSQRWNHLIERVMLEHMGEA
jgi:GT2 family glycosyltransferase